MRRIFICFSFFWMLATADADVIAFQFPERSLGINADHLLLDVRLNEGGVITYAAESKASDAQVREIYRLAAQSLDPWLLADNRRKTEVPPPSLPDAAASRCSVFAKDTGKLWEYHFFTEANLPSSLQEALVE